MTVRPAPCVAWLILLLAGVAAVGEAQELASSFGQLRVLVKPGDQVSVTDRAGQEVRGRIADLSSSSLELLVDGTQRRFAEGEIDSIRQRRSDPLANGAKWGFAVGAGLGALAGLTLANEFDGSATGVIPMLALAYGGMGAGIGAGIDAMVSAPRVIYARGSSSKVTVRPLFAPGRKGVLASVAF
jgi:hypothetical protein